jgi:hypothetical protein
MAFLIPNSNGEDNSPARLHESNDCHVPAGSPAGGQFCSEPGGYAGKTSIQVETVAEVEARILAQSDVTPAERKYVRQLARAEVFFQQVKAEGGTTKDRHTLPDGSYTPERMRLHEDILQRFFEDRVQKYGRMPVEGLDRPTVTFMAGMPGAGKSTVAGDLMKHPDIVKVDADDLKEYFEEYRGGLGAGVVAAESNDLADKLVELAIARKMNVIIDGTLKTSGTPQPSMHDGAQGRMLYMKQHGYRIELRFINATLEQSVESVVTRFGKAYMAQGFGRYVSPSFVRSLSLPSGKTKPRKTFTDVRHLSFKGSPLVDAWGEWAFRGDMIRSKGQLSNGMGS